MIEPTIHSATLSKCGTDLRCQQPSHGCLDLLCRKRGSALQSKRRGAAECHMQPSWIQIDRCGLTDEAGRCPDEEGRAAEAADAADPADADDAGREPASPPLAPPKPPKPGNSCCRNCGSGTPAPRPSPPASPLPPDAAAAACGLFTNSLSFSQVSSSFSSETSCR
jgi:hypothetical protein